MDNKILWIFLHLPRIGGNTISEFIRKRVLKEEIFLSSIERYQKNPKVPDKNKTKFMFGHATYYGMHKLIPGKEPRYFVFLRDPAERLISHYNSKMQNEKKRIPFDKWYKNQIKNEVVHILNLKLKGSESTRINTPKLFLPILRRLNYKTTYFIQTIMFNLFGLNKKNNLKKLENAKKLLDLCWFVGISEKSKIDFKFLLNIMGIRNKKIMDLGVSKKIVKINDQLRKKIYRENPLDVELYNYALKLNKSKRLASSRS